MLVKNQGEIVDNNSQQNITFCQCLSWNKTTYIWNGRIGKVEIRQRGHEREGDWISARSPQCHSDTG